MQVITRNIAPLLLKLASQYPVMTLTGPRQSGKTTLAKALFPSKPYVSLEDPDIRRFASNDPRGFLAQYAGGAIFDEIQRVPELPSYLQGVVEANAKPGQLILTGSQQFELMTQVTQSLAGGTGILRLLPLTLAEAQKFNKKAVVPELAGTLLKGFYPRIHDQKLDPLQALADYISTYVERDLRQLAAVQDLQRFEHFVHLCAGRAGQLLNLVILGNDAVVSQPTARA